MKAFLRKNRSIIIVTLALAALLILLRTFVFHLVTVEGQSMEPTLSGGDLVLVTRYDYLGDRTPERGDIVECRFPGRSGKYIKRLIGLPGEHIEIAGGRLYIDGRALSEPYASGPMADYSIALAEDEYFVLGDNRSKSYDNRAPDMALLHADCFLGRVRLRILPLGRAIN